MPVTLADENFCQQSDATLMESMPSFNEHCDVVDQVGKKLTTEEFKTAVKSEAEVLVAKFSSKPNLPRNCVQNIVDDTTSFLSSGFLNIMKDKVMMVLNSSGANEGDVEDVSDMFAILENPFESLQTEYRRFKCFSECGDYIAPVPYLIGRREGRKKGAGLQYVDVYGQSIPLRMVRKKFLELPHALSDIKNYTESLKSEVETISNFVQSSLWQQKISKYGQNDIVLPLIVYYDDFEVHNPLGPHSGKLGGVYISIPCLPPECVSQVENIFLALLFKSKDRDDFGNKKAFDPLVTELTFLETVGLDINTESGVEHVFFMVGLIIGDNLGVNTMCGFAMSFRANHFCRFCKTSRYITESQLTVDRSLLRDPVNYAEDITIQDVSLTGVKEECDFNQVPSFHVTQNFAVDVMHDLEEGVAHYVLLYLLRRYINVKRYFSLEELNCRVLVFDYGPIDVSNRPPRITHDCLATGKKLKMTASETLCFTRYFGSLIGDKIPVGDTDWKLYLALLRVTEVAMAKVVPKNISPLLTVLIKELNDLFVTLTGDTLKPKFHFCLHYPMVLDHCGSLVHISTKRFESNNQELKRSATPNMSRRNITYSVAVKQQLSLCYRLKANQGIRPVMESGPCNDLNITSLDFYNMIQNSLPAPLKESAQCCSTSWVKFKGTKFAPGMILVRDMEDYLPAFCEIHTIVLYDRNPLFICKSLKTVGFHEHTNTYEVKYDLNWLCITVTDLYDPLPVYKHRRPDGKMYVVLRYLI